MKPLKLTLQAFGPYAGKELIDFTRLENRTMFVVSGKTGSGKTTIFDGISYAIYGKASGEDRSGSDLRSQFAKNALLTEVSLDFTLRRKTYRIIRSPQQDKKKERGEGYTTIGAKAELYLLNDDGTSELLAANVREVDEKIKEIMIIDSNQFRQILMIPQGEFRKLLTSDSKEKEMILQRLFHTEIYKKIEERLKEEATELKKQVESQVGERSAALKRSHHYQNDELKDLLAEGNTNDVIMIPLINEEITAMIARLKELNNEKLIKQRERDALQQKLFEAESIIKQLETMEQLRQRKVELAERRSFFEEKEKEASLAKKAALLDSQEELCHRLKKDMDQLDSFIKDRTNRIAVLYENLKKSEQELNRQNEREQERKELAETVSQLEHIKEDVKSLASHQEETERLSKTLDAVKKQNEQCVAVRGAVEEEKETLLTEKTKIEKIQLVFLEGERILEKLAQELDKLRKYESYLNKIQGVKIELEKRIGVLKNAEARLSDGQELVQQLEQTWLHSQAAILASMLDQGQECPVCGSEHHPKLAVSEHDFIPTEQDLKAAREQARMLESEKTKYEKLYFETKSTLNSLEENGEEQRTELFEILPEFSESKLEDALISTQSKLAQMSEVQSERANEMKRLPLIKTKLTELEERKLDLETKEKDFEERLRQLTIQFTEKKTILARMTDRIPENLRSLQVYKQQYELTVRKQEELMRQLEVAQKQYQDAKDLLEKENTRREEAEKRLAETKEKLTEERAHFKENMNKQGFETYSQYHDAKRTEDDILKLEAKTRQYREEFRSVLDRLEEYENRLKDVQKPDIVGLRKGLLELDEGITKLQEVYQNLFIQKRENEQIITKVVTINEHIKLLEERYKIVGNLYEISKGQNTYRITFERYVLATFLDDILAEANIRLAKMTSGRYRLLRKTDRSKGNVQSGLELLVFDQYTGQERHVKTLSGGESFKAALSLALGLADVVQNHAGGVSLETMFIDEGFGTLDPESLDQAIETLFDIQSNGRLVGIISHVPELKERIDARLEVTATQTGSVTEFYFFNG
ncbi:AAA family ATPase [Bacillus sp. B15-48]|uniref:AAA family ATPase n=1 Tax=Bacillus sp. B15-48 TaxID=1548601 RepID=UPI00193EE526|nr:AAA family ATPase [Bacillus sp. B15-48]MBM4762800.1 AAA family ATPase [Bacillus sp. B15-48]